MADYTAVLVASAITTLAGSVSPNLSAYTDIYATADNKAATAASSGSFAVGQFVPLNAPSVSAVTAPSPGRQFLDRVHLVEHVNYEYPTLSADVVTYMEVYNANRVPTDLNAITVSSPDDVEVEHVGYYRQAGLVVGTAPDDPPTTFAAFESRRYQMTVIGAGANTAFVLVTFDFASQDFSFTIDAIRVTAFAFQINWDADVIEGIGYLTDVIKSYNDTEQRRALRFWPRNKVEYHFLPGSAREASAFETMIFYAQGKVNLLPVWQDIGRTTALTADASITIPVVTAGMTYRVGGSAILWNSWEDYEIVEIGIVGASSLTLAHPVLREWPSGTRIMPCRLARMQQQIDIGRPTSTILETGYTFEFDPADVPAVLTGATYPYTYRSNPVWTTRSNAETDTALAHGVKGVYLDNKTGAQSIVEHTDHPLLVERPVGLLLKDRAAITEFRKFLGDRRGRQVAFWRPTWNRDFEAVTGVTSGLATITVQRNYYTRFIPANTARKDIVIVKTDGTMVFARILSAQESGGNDVLTMTTNWGSTINLADIFMICYLNFVRLDSDDTQLHWHTNTVVTTEIPLHVLAAPA